MSLVDSQIINKRKAIIKSYSTWWTSVLTDNVFHFFSAFTKYFLLYMIFLFIDFLPFPCSSQRPQYRQMGEAFFSVLLFLSLFGSRSLSCSRGSSFTPVCWSKIILLHEFVRAAFTCGVGYAYASSHFSHLNSTYQQWYRNSSYPICSW